MNIELRPPDKSEEDIFVLENQAAFDKAAIEEFGPQKESVLDERGKVAPSKIKALVFDQFQHGYYAMGDQVGKAWNAGAKLMKQ